MPKYLKRAGITEVPRHRFVSYLHFLDTTEARSKEEYISIIKKQFEEYTSIALDEERKVEALAALTWLVETNLAKMV